VIGRLFSRKRREEPVDPLPTLRIDLHSHILPGIDDGAKNIEKSLEMLRAMQELGYEKVITTPHVMADAYRNTTRTILEKLALLRQAAKQEGLEIEIEAAAEYYMDEELSARLEKDDILTIGGEYLLFETSYISKPLNFEEVVYEMQAKGYKALFAHPERYRYITDPQKEYSEIKKLGVLFQIDINSLGGQYGKQAQENAQLLSEWGLVDFLGSDAHGTRHIQFLKKVFADPKYHKLLKNNTILNDIVLKA